MRVDTGPFFGGETRAWIAAVWQEATDWVQGSAWNEREHVAAKLVSSRARLGLTGYISFDAIHEDTYQRLYREADFKATPRWGRLVGDWPGVPYLDQFYWPGWQTRWNNTLAYVRADWSFSELSSLRAGTYYHRNRGRGAGCPPISFFAPQARQRFRRPPLRAGPFQVAPVPHDHPDGQVVAFGNYALVQGADEAAAR